MECRLLDDEEKDVAPGQPGEIFVRGPNICMGYWKNEAATKEAISADRWLKTGDIAVMKNDYFWIVDRKKVCVSCSKYEILLIKGKGINQSKWTSSSTR